MKKIKNFVKKNVRKYINKKLTGSHPKHYYFFRWLAEAVKDKESTDDVCGSIASWLANNENKFTYLFNDVFVVDNFIYLVTFRPGLWIGKKGSTINSVIDHINTNVEGVKIHNYDIRIIEEHKTNYADIINYMNFYQYYA